MDNTNKTVIIGGGIIGALSAYFLRKKGGSVTIVEKEQFGNGCSYGNCGLIHPTHVLPLSMPGAVMTGLKWMLKKDAPIYIKPRFDFGFIKWLINFTGKCNKKDMFDSAAGRNALLSNSIESFSTLIQQENILCDWENKGIIYAFKSKTDFDHHDQTDSWISKITKGGQKLNRHTLIKMEPLFNENVIGGWFYENTGHLRPDLLMKELKRILIRMGVSIIENTEVKELSKRDNRAVAVKTEGNEIEAGEFIFTAGAWTSRLDKVFDFKIPIQPGKGYSITMERPQNCPAIPCMLEEERVVATPWKSGYRLGGTMEFSGFDDTLNQKRLKSLISSTRKYFKNPEYEGTKEEWSGWRPMTYDGLPVIDRVPGLKNVLVAAGHNMLGLSMAPATGKLVSEMIHRENPHIDPYPYRISRF